jgi:hypothetical protein
MADIEVIVDERALDAELEAIKELGPKFAIKPELPPLGKITIERARPYPPEGLVLLSSQQLRQRRAGARALGGGLFGSILAGSISGVDTSRGAAQYRRTGHFGQMWQESLQGDLTEKVENVARYAGWVMGPKQPYTWRYGWRRLREIGLEILQEVFPEIEKKILRKWLRKK